MNSPLSSPLSEGKKDEMVLAEITRNDPVRGSEGQSQQEQSMNAFELHRLSALSSSIELQQGDNIEKDKALQDIVASFRYKNAQNRRSVIINDAHISGEACVEFGNMFVQPSKFAMSKNKDFRPLLPANETEETESEVKEKTRRNISLACTECQEKKTKVTIPAIPRLEDRANTHTLIQCSGTMPCTRCATEGCQCLYNQSGDRRRKEYTARLLDSHAALCRLAAKLRSTTPEEILQLVSQIQSLPSDQDAVHYLHTLD
ncbi:hypothetical protein ASPZODRAFT_147848 [Penicilliopsis zonata CBS 506.65]|uniref:Uncharacterized protein n=1 Tax=Penicilliopsis zonata CBS 506.65 TaxID=1073090 RepID=A0A1L9S4F1_9EURO|nr:hypothetical protein ASPZODRAFT_147848 [Penicilliopsis zonata CBS 506.65]OJJ42041.1 hypothetical protein ASPZODRAFT_147848 [Penicilliopsis zonata CBS 506.65]